MSNKRLGGEESNDNEKKRAKNDEDVEHETDEDEQGQATMVVNETEVTDYIKSFTFGPSVKLPPTFPPMELTMAPVLVTTPFDLFAFFAPGAVGNLAITASINGAFAAAFAPNGPVGAIIAVINNNIAVINNNIAAINNNMSVINNNVVALTARMDNVRFQTRNNSIFNGSVSFGSAASILTPLLKMTPGAGAALHGVAAAALPVGHPFAIGAPIPSPPFPNSVATFATLTLPQISLLAILYNDDFGIVAGDLLPTWLDKFKQFICGL